MAEQVVLLLPWGARSTMLSILGFLVTNGFRTFDIEHPDRAFSYLGLSKKQREDVTALLRQYCKELAVPCTV